MDLTNRIAETIRRVDGKHELGAGTLAEYIADDLADLESRAALAERVRIVADVHAMAEDIRRTSYTPATGVALGAIVDSIADRINTL